MSKDAKRLLKRSGLSKCPICNYQGFLVEHHIRGRKVYKWNSKSNIVYICPNCHDRVHNDKKFKINKWVFTSNGKKLEIQINNILNYI